MLQAGYWYCTSKHFHTKDFVPHLPNNLCFGHYPFSWVFSVTVQPTCPVTETIPFNWLHGVPTSPSMHVMTKTVKFAKRCVEEGK